MPLEIALPVELELRVQEYVASGRYGSVSDLVCDALRLLDASIQAEDLARLAALKADIALGLADIQAGHCGPLDIDMIKQQGRAALLTKAPC